VLLVAGPAILSSGVKTVMDTHMGRLPSLIAASLVAWLPVAQERPVTDPLPMRHLEACRIELSPLTRSADFSGTVEYRAIVNPEGVIKQLTFVREPATPPEAVSMRRFVRLDQFESCVQRWRFGAAGSYRIILQGGTMSDGKWFITASQGDKSIRFVMPHRL
jgi:hypothetical protein